MLYKKPLKFYVFSFYFEKFLYSLSSFVEKKAPNFALSFYRSYRKSTKNSCPTSIRLLRTRNLKNINLVSPQPYRKENIPDNYPTCILFSFCLHIATYLWHLWWLYFIGFMYAHLSSLVLCAWGATSGIFDAMLSVIYMREARV